MSDGVGVETGEEGIRLGLLAVLSAGVRRCNPGAVVNAIVALAGTYVPNVAAARYELQFRPWQRLYVESAMLTHAAGMLGPYDDVWWWDHVTHAHSASIVGGAIHTVARRQGRDPVVHVLGGVFAAGLVWETIEYVVHYVSRRLGFKPLLVSYGYRDTVLDLVFNLVGGVVVLVFGDHVENLVETSEGDSSVSDRQ
jgi:hypothetical protein